MQPIQPDQATFLLNGVYLPGLKGESKITKNIIAAIPLDKGDYRPDEISMTAMGLAYHIAISEMRFMDAITTGAFDLTPRPMPESIKNSADLVKWYEENFNAHIESLSKMTTEQLMKIIDFRGMFQLPAVMYLGFILHHSVHHRGQLSMYLRPMGAKVPSIYGESYDATQARLAAAGS
jgi:uncharacterized damage-inducible protein DinB